jgi:hypothetical protein
VTVARATDGNEGLTIQDSPVSWIEARDVGGYTTNGYYVAPYQPLFACLLTEEQRLTDETDSN